MKRKNYRRKGSLNNPIVRRGSSTITVPRGGVRL